LLFCEHAAAQGWRGNIQRGLNNGWGRLFSGCNLTRDPIVTIAAAGFDIEDLAVKPFPISLALLGVHISGRARVRTVPARPQHAFVNQRVAA
jgi:hypothetical protein